MIIPLTHEHTTVQRMPWVTFGIMALCFAAHLGVSSGAVDEEVEEKHREALQYVLRHPHLDVNPRLLPPGVEVPQLGQGEPAGGSELERQQAELDHLTGQWMESLERHPLWRHGLIPAEFSVIDLVTYMFLHGGWLHLLGNMFFLYLTGPFVEDAWGRPQFAAVYLASGVAAAALYSLQYPSVQGPLVGASGAVAAVLGAFLLLRWRTRIRFLLFLGVMVATFNAPAWLMLPLWFLGELFGALRADAVLPGAGGGGVAYWAHVWGFVLGLGAAFAVRRLWPERLPKLVAGPPAHRSSPMLARARRDLARGLYPRAWQLLSEEARTNPGDEEVTTALWELAVQLGRHSEIPEVGMELVRRRLQAGARAESLRLFRQLEEARPGERRLAAVAVRLAEELAEEQPQEAKLLVRRTLEEAGTIPAGLVVRSARLAARLDPSLAREAAERALAYPDLDPDTRAELLSVLGD
jgi:membrane associated rhomboid family serine protease